MMILPGSTSEPLKAAYGRRGRRASGQTPNFSGDQAWVFLPIRPPLASRSDEPVLVGVGRRCRAGRHVQLHENVAHVPVDRLPTEVELPCDVLVGLSNCDEAQDLELASAERVLARNRGATYKRFDRRDIRRCA